MKEMWKTQNFLRNVVCCGVNWVPACWEKLASEQSLG